MKKKLVLAIMTITLVAAMVSGASYSWYTDLASVGPNIFTAAELLVTEDMVLWLDASTLNLENEESVSLWKDKSAYSNDATAPSGFQLIYISSVPGLDSKPAIRFNGTSYFDLGDPEILRFTSSVTAFFVAKRESDGRLLSKVTLNRATYYDYHEGKLRYDIAPDSGSLVGVMSDNQVGSDYNIIAFTYNATAQNIILHLNRILAGFTDEGVPTSQYNSNNANWNIGRDSRNEVYLKGDIAEIIIYKKIGICFCLEQL